MKKYLPLSRFKSNKIRITVKKQKKMKKLAFLFVTVAALSFASCGNKAANNNEEVENEEVTVEEVVDNATEETEAVDSVAVEAEPAAETPAAE